MATRSRGNSTGMAVALVIFVLLFVFSLGAAILTMSKVEQAETTAAKAKKDLDEYVKGGDSSKPAVQDARAAIIAEKKGDSVVTWLVNENDKLKRTIQSGLESSRGIDAVLKANKLADGRDLISHIIALRADGATLAQREAAEKAAKEMLAAKIAELEKEKAAIEAKYREEDGKRTAQITSISTANDTAKTNVDTTIKGLQDAQTKAAEEAKAAVEKKDQELASKEAEILELRRVIQKLRELINPGGDKTTRDATSEADGSILSIIAQDNLVTIDLGKKNHVLLGLTFEVFDKRTGVTRDQFNDVRGKATIEVIKVKDTSCECRIVRSDRGKPIQEGDIIANVVYDKYRTYKFYVYGNFDIDNDGRPSPTDARRIKSMITQWGGVVADEFGFDVDFLVLGVKPSLPPLPPGGADSLTPEQIEERASKEREGLKFEQLIGDARLLRVPVLNQNRFLTLIGYYER
jgi:hypothetical protein